MAKATPKAEQTEVDKDKLIEELRDQNAQLEQQTEWLKERSKEKDDRITALTKRNEMLGAEMRGMGRAFGMFMGMV